MSLVVFSFTDDFYCSSRRNAEASARVSFQVLIRHTDNNLCFHRDALKPFYFLLPISRERIVFRSNFQNGDFDGLTRFEVP